MPRNIFTKACEYPVRFSSSP